jgi:hypothetical protein
MRPLLLTFAVAGADAYRIGAEPWEYELADAIEEESHTVAGDANSDHLPDPSDETREAFRVRVVHEATRALRSAGDEYRDPIGVLWRLELGGEEL